MYFERRRKKQNNQIWFKPKSNNTLWAKAKSKPKPKPKPKPNWIGSKFSIKLKRENFRPKAL